MSLAGASSTIHDLKVIFTGIDRVSHVADSIQSKVKALGGAITALGGTGLLVTSLAEQFGFLEKSQADALNKTFALVTATGSLITIFSRLIPVLQGLTLAQTLANTARAIALALSGPVGWGILAGAAVALAAFGIFMATQTGTPAAGAERPVGGRAVSGLTRGQFGLDTMVLGPTLFLAGESGREHVRITPEGGEGPRREAERTFASMPGSLRQVVDSTIRETKREQVTVSPPNREISEGGLTANINIYGASDPEEAARAVKRELEILIDRERIRRS